MWQVFTATLLAQSYSLQYSKMSKNRNVFCKPQDLLTIPLHIYLPVSETLKYNMDSFTRVFGKFYEKYNLISCFWACFAFIFVFWKKYIWLFALHLKNKSFCVWTQAPCSVIHIGGNLKGNQAKLNCGYCIDDLRATLNLGICCL